MVYPPPTTKQPLCYEIGITECWFLYAMIPPPLLDIVGPQLENFLIKEVSFWRDSLTSIVAVPCNI